MGQVIFAYSMAALGGVFIMVFEKYYFAKKAIIRAITGVVAYTFYLPAIYLMRDADLYLFESLAAISSFVAVNLFTFSLAGKIWPIKTK